MKAKRIKNVPAVQKEMMLFSSKEYESTLADLKKQVRECQLKAAIVVNRELIKLYWRIGRTIVERQEDSGWGTKFIEKLA